MRNLVAVLALMIATMAEAGSGSPKKGLGMWALSGARAPEVGASWYYDWKPYSSGGSGFIPMIWGWRDDYPAAYQAIRDQQADAVMGVNEPDHCDQACMNPDQGVYLWKKTAEAAAGKRLVSPAVASNYGWLDQWWAKAQAQGLRMPDVVAVHTYPNMGNPSQAAQQVLGLVDWVAQRYGRPVWLTEFGACGGSEQGAVQFIKEVVAGLEARPHVERYAWFSDAPAACYKPLFDGRGQITWLGQAYRDAG